MKKASSLRKVHVVTGNSECLNNVYLAVCLQRYFESNSCIFIDSADEADVLVLNVCNVFVETPKQVRDHAELARDNPDKQVLVVGCVPGSARVASPPKNFHVLPYGRLVREPSLIGPRMGFSRDFSLLKADEVLQGYMLGSRLPYPPSESCYITIGSGCQGRCTFCSIKLARGGSRSVDPDEIVADAKAGMAKGRFRFIMICDDAGCWGKDLGLDLPCLLLRIRKACPRARFVLLDFNPEHLPGMYKKLKPFLGSIDYLYLPMQAGSDRILDLMDRGYHGAEVLDLVRRIRKENPGIYLETDIIVGFPTETREEFSQSLRAARAFHRAAFVPFVPKPDTPAAELPGRLEAGEMRRRMELVRHLGRRFGFKAVDPSILGEGHGDVGKISLEGRRDP